MSTAGSVHMISRGAWGARSPKQRADQMKGPAKYVFVHHSAGPFATDKDSCIKQVQGFQNTHMDERKWDDIGYSFVVGEDGNVYEARGWTAVGAHTLGYNNVSIGICVIGNFNTRKPNSAAVSTVQSLIQTGVTDGHVCPQYTLKGHRDVGVTECPGQSLYNLIQSWPHYASGK
eukprot:TRINITY_DN119762_c0_g1_i1.p2 TRINITY_DN119762_c0_g1~~TRINITY_DN119762_c0_g1_i1.p2  ORF type:complete len:174 (-),score=24.67 TRINITY_DN119762_c0_g1_i1:225-746(-)